MNDIQVNDSAEFGHENAVIGIDAINQDARKERMVNASNAALSGSESVGPLPGRLTWPQVRRLPLLGGPTFVVRRTFFFLRVY